MSPSRSAPRTWQVWVDTGGTFTDCLAVAPRGELHRVKVLSSSALRGRIAARRGARSLVLDGFPALPPGFFAGFAFRLLGGGEEWPAVGWDPESRRLDLAEDLPDLPPGAACELVSTEEPPLLAARIATGTPPDRPLPPLAMRLATTRGTNALLERKGAAVAFFVTAGFGDLLLIGTQQRPDLFALAIEKPPPLYREVVEVEERLAADGSVLRPLDREGAKRAAGAALSRGATSAAVALLHAYRNPCHERDLLAILRDVGFRFVALSSQLAPEIKLLPRAQTAVVEAYLAPILAGYLARVASALGESPLHVMTSAGGLARARSPRQRPGGSPSGLAESSFRAVDGLLSGPAGGVLGAARAASRSGLPRILSFDMGGTSTDVARFDGDVELSFEHRVGDAHLVAPALAIETVAAGGGSICSVAGAGREAQLKVGPESAGAHPGPACYGAGGPLTITDVNLLLGRLDPGRFGIPIDVAAAQERAAEVAAHAGGEIEALLEGYLEIANERMADAIRRISVGRGFDPAEFALVAFGGAGAQHACAVADLLGMRTILVPQEASLLSALGLSAARIERFAVRQVLRPLAECNNDLPALAGELAAEATAAVAEEGVVLGEIEIRCRIAQLRFAGQETSLAIDFGEPGAAREAPDLTERFLAAYRAIYGYAPEGRPIEVEALRVAAASRPEPDPPLPPEPQPTEALPSGTRRARFAGAWVEVPAYDRAALAPGATFAGPCLVFEDLSATVVEPDWRGRVDGAGGLLLAR
ncbi:MAG TPA: hydantoinase/oxoprolinase family protein [Thermoanaerobaculia bacterium]|nr:hydantoinase/oxoprolinase family protein [Thermoanaerobaculia bacterium]